MEDLHLNESEEERIITITKALSSKTRFKILQLLAKDAMDISRLAEELNQTEANVSAQVKQLEKAGLLDTRYEPGSHGVRKICKTAVANITIEVSASEGAATPET